jgi:hypothetical protein
MGISLAALSLVVMLSDGGGADARPAVSVPSPLDLEALFARGAVDVIRQATCVVRLSMAPEMDGECGATVAEVVKGTFPQRRFRLACEAGPFDLRDRTEQHTGLLFGFSRAALEDADARSENGQIFVLLYQGRWYALTLRGRLLWQADRWDTDASWEGGVEMLLAVVRRLAQGAVAGPLLNRDRVWWSEPVPLAPGGSGVTGLAVENAGLYHCPDVFLLRPGREGDMVYTYTSRDRGFQEVTAARRVVTHSLEACFADMNGDGRLDLVSYGNSRLVAWLAAAEHTYSVRLASLPTSVGVAGLKRLGKGAGHADRVLVTSNGAPMIVEAAGAGLRVKGLIAENKSDMGTSRACVAGDYDGDGIADVVQPFEWGALLWKGTSGGEFMPSRSAVCPQSEARLIMVPVSEEGFLVSKATRVKGGVLYSGTGRASVAQGDVDGDGRPDIFFFASDETRMWWNRGRGFFDGPYPSGSLERSARVDGGVGAVGDVTGDGWDDVVVGEGKWLKVYASWGFGSFRQLPSPEGEIDTGGVVRQCVLADLDGDGRTDILWLSADGSVKALLQSSQRSLRCCHFYCSSHR